MIPSLCAAQDSHAPWLGDQPAGDGHERRTEDTVGSKTSFTKSHTKIASGRHSQDSSRKIRWNKKMAFKVKTLADKERIAPLLMRAAGVAFMSSQREYIDCHLKENKMNRRRGKRKQSIQSHLIWLFS